MSADRDGDRHIGLIGESGGAMMELRRGDVVVATYLGHVEGKLWETVPILGRTLPAANSDRYTPNT